MGPKRSPKGLQEGLRRVTEGRDEDPEGARRPKKPPTMKKKNLQRSQSRSQKKNGAKTFPREGLIGCPERP
jgi:hypothetical protein